MRPVHEHHLPMIVLITLILIAIGPARSVAQQAPELFQLTGSRPAGTMPLQAISAESVVVDLELMDALVPGMELALDVTPSDTFNGVVEWVEPGVNGTITVSGIIPGTVPGRIILVKEGDVVAGVIRIPSAERFFRVRHDRDGVHTLYEIDPAFFPPESPPAAACENDPSQEERAQEVSPPSSGGSPDDRDDRSCERPAPVWDIAVIYSSVARQAMGGNPAIEAECLLAVAVANQAYIDSAIDARMRLVARGEVAYNESGDFYDHLDWLKSNCGGIRDTYHADFVTMLVDDGQYCGLGQCYSGGSSSRAYTVCNWGCAAANYTLAHEVGHNMGCDHDSANAGGCGGPSWALGWRWNGNSGTQWRSVMAYSPGTRVGHFSDPNVSYDGQPTGVSIGSPDEADNAQRIRDVARTVEDYRLTRFDVWVDFAYGGSETGSFDHPYDTLAEGVSAVITGYSAPELPSVWLKAGSSDETITISQPVVLRACGGSVTIGQ